MKHHLLRPKGQECVCRVGARARHTRGEGAKASPGQDGLLLICKIRFKTVPFPCLATVSTGVK